MKTNFIYKENQLNILTNTAIEWISFVSISTSTCMITGNIDAFFDLFFQRKETFIVKSLYNTIENQ